jgi:hypothetical protein
VDYGVGFGVWGSEGFTYMGVLGVLGVPRFEGFQQGEDTVAIATSQGIHKPQAIFEISILICASVGFEKGLGLQGCSQKTCILILGFLFDLPPHFRPSGVEMWNNISLM